MQDPNKSPTVPSGPGSPEKTWVIIEDVEVLFKNMQIIRVPKNQEPHFKIRT